jgi:exopolysaccharide production protein ExoY
MRKTARQNVFKRLFDLAFSSFALLLLSPVFLCIAVAIKCTSSGSILYFHKRIGKGGTPFYCCKFRTMYEDAESSLERLFKQHPELGKEWQENRKLSRDPRITPIGLFLRKTSLDELPQFFNVLRGEMSIVGPRPVVEDEIKKFYKEHADSLLSIRPGITGLWQVSGRSLTSYAERIALDIEYVRTRSFLKDLFIIARTVSIVFSRKGAC